MGKIDKYETFEVMLKKAVSGYEPVKKVIWNCWNISEKLDLDPIGFYLYDEDGVKYLNANFALEKEDENGWLNKRLTICFG